MLQFSAGFIDVMNLIQNRKIRLLPHLLISAFVFILFIYLGTLLPTDASDDTMSQLAEMVTQLANLGPIPLTIVIFLNNAFKCLLIILLGVLVGIPSIAYVSINASVIGILIANWPGDAYLTLIAGLLPHGIIEIPLLLLSAAFGLSIGQEVLKFITRQESAVRTQLSSCLRFYYKWIILLLFVAAVIEVFITPQIIALVGGADQVIIP